MAVATLSLGGAALAEVQAQDVTLCDPSGVCYGTLGDDRMIRKIVRWGTSRGEPLQPSDKPSTRVGQLHL